MRVKTYVTWKELNGGVPSTLAELRNYLSRYGRDSVLYVCSALNCLLRFWDDPGIDEKVHTQFLGACFPAHIANQLSALCAGGGRAVFTRPQLLFVMKEACLNSPENGADPRALPFLGGIGIPLLMANDHLHYPIADSLRGVPDRLSALASFIPLAEHSALDAFAPRAARSAYILNTVVPELSGHPAFVDLDSAFRAATGVGCSMFQALIFGVMSKYFDLRPQDLAETPDAFLLPREFLALPSIPNQDRECFFAAVTSDGDALAACIRARDYGPMDFTCFKNHTMLKTKEGIFPVDPVFLAEKIDSGIFWGAFKGIQNEGDRSKLSIFWGAVFHRYVEHLLRSTADPRINRVVVSPRFESDDAEACDVLILSGSEAVMIECKGATFTAEAKYSGDTQLLDAELEKKLKYGKQLARSIGRLFGCLRFLPFRMLRLRLRAWALVVRFIKS
jgi:hypothetical protein